MLRWHRQRGRSAERRQGGLLRPARHSGKDKPTAVIIAGVQGDETHEARLRGYRDAIEAAGGQVLEVQYTDTMPDKAAAAMEAVIQKYPNGVDAVLSIADDMALAAAKVIKDSGNTNYADTVSVRF